MNTGAKLAIAGVGTAVLVVIIYAIFKGSRNVPAVSAMPSTPAVLPQSNYRAPNSVIDTSNISKPSSSPIVNNIDTGGVHMAVKTYPNESGLRAYRDVV